MELSSTDPIFKILNDLKSYINDNNEVSIKFHNYTEWTEMEFDNFAKVFRNNYKEIIDDEVLEVVSESEKSDEIIADEDYVSEGGEEFNDDFDLDDEL